jgi:hypothetical protein
MVTSEVIVSMMNSYDPSGDIEGDIEEEQLVEQHVEAPTSQVQEVPVQVPGTESIEDMEIDPPVPESTKVEVETTSTSVRPVGTVPDVGLITVETDTDIPELIHQGEDDSDDETEEEEEQQPPRCSARIAQGILKPSKYAMVSVGTSVLTQEQRNAAINRAEEAEIRQVFVDLKALAPVKKEEVEGDPLNCHIFTVEKFLANGEHDKVKSRFVTNGNEQDQELYPDKASPTVTIHSILACLAVASNKKKWEKMACFIANC